MKVTGTKLPINLLQGLFYEERPVSLGVNVNSKYDEMAPVISPDEATIYFSRKNSPQNIGGPQDIQDVYYSEFNVHSSLFENKKIPGIRERWWNNRETKVADSIGFGKSHFPFL